MNFLYKHEFDIRELQILGSCELLMAINFHDYESEIEKSAIHITHTVHDKNSRFI